MSYSRPQRHRSDKNQHELVKLFRRLGGYWLPYANKPFDGWAWHPMWVLRQPYFKPLMGGYAPVEIKDPKRKNHADRYTERQIKVMDEMTKRGAVWLEWETEEDVYKCVDARRAA